MSVAAPSVKDYLVASNAAYCEAPLAEASSTNPTQAVLLADATNALKAMGETSWKVLAVQYTPADGFYGAAYLTNTGNLVIGYEGTAPNVSVYGAGTIAADAKILAHQTPTQTVADVTKFATSAEVTACQTAGFTGNAYVTGHSLGGIEAEYAALSLNSTAGHVTGVNFAGGVTFGATGIPGYSNSGSTIKMTDYVDYGDPVGNYASHMPSGAGKDFIDIPFITPVQDHVGTVVMEGNPSSWNFLSADFLAFQYHLLPNYQNDAGVSITGAPYIPGTAALDAFASLFS